MEGLKSWNRSYEKLFHKSHTRSPLSATDVFLKKSSGKIKHPLGVASAAGLLSAQKFLFNFGPPSWKQLTTAPPCGDLFFRSSDEFVQYHWGRVRKRENAFIFSWIHSGCCHLMIASEQTLDGNIKWIISLWFIFFFLFTIISESRTCISWIILCFVSCLKLIYISKHSNRCFC